VRGSMSACPEARPAPDAAWSRAEAGPSRRLILGGAGAALAAAWALTALGAEEAPGSARDALAQPGDQLAAFMNGGAGPVVAPVDIKGEAPLLAWPFDPARKLVRDGSRLNLVLVIRFDPATLSAAERPHAANGIVAYTAVCTHQGCWVTDWLAAQQLLHCPCHGSRYDPRRDGKVVLGPAPRPLPALPLRIEREHLLVARPFTGRIGGEKPGGGY
jgi:rieske iron-sulfur protein